MPETLTGPVLPGLAPEEKSDFDQISKGAVVLLSMAFEEIRKLRRMTLHPGAATRRDSAVMLIEQMELQTLQLRNILQHMQKEC